MNHTVSGQDWQNLWFNGTLVGETGINAALCGHWGCPVLLVTGDEATCARGAELLGDGLTTVAVKRGLGPLSARQLPPLRARELIEEGARRRSTDLSGAALRPGPALRDQGRVQEHGRSDKLRAQAGVERPRRSDRRFPRGHLVGSMAQFFLR